MTGVVCPHCNASYDSDRRLARADVTECKICQQKFVVTQNTLRAYKEVQQEPLIQPVVSPPSPVELVTINCPHCATALQGEIVTGQIVACSECHRQFEATAERLNHTPQVLSKAPVPAELASSKPKSKAGLLLAIAVGLIFLFPLIMPESSDNNTATTQPAPATPEPVKDPNAPERFLSAWNGSNRELVKLVESNMKDPKSFEHVETQFIDNGDSLKLRMTYRGKNSFNATVTNQVTADLNKSTRTLSNVQ